MPPPKNPPVADEIWSPEHNVGFTFPWGVTGNVVAAATPGIAADPTIPATTLATRVTATMTASRRVPTDDRPAPTDVHLSIGHAESDAWRPEI